MKKPFAASLAALLIAACGSDSKKDDDATGDGSDGTSADGSDGASGGDGCASFCTEAGYEGGSAFEFNGNVTECICSGGAGSIGADACDAYCGELDIPAEYAYENAAENKCVCDGTQLPSGDGSDGSMGDGSSDGSDGSMGDGSSDGSDGSTGDDLFETDSEGFPVLPADPFATNAQGSIWVSITDSNLTHLPTGEYVAPISYNASSASSLTFFDPGYIFANEPVIQVQVNIKSEKMNGMFECEDVYGMVVRYGNPPSGANASVVISCASTYTYDAGTNSYTGTLEAELGGAYVDENMPTETGTFKARFAYIDEVP